MRWRSVSLSEPCAPQHYNTGGQSDAFWGVFGGTSTTNNTIFFGDQKTGTVSVHGNQGMFPNFRPTADRLLGTFENALSVNGNEVSIALDTTAIDATPGWSTAGGSKGVGIGAGSIFHLVPPDTRNANQLRPERQY